ncbi:MAG: hypothetical protein CMD18_02290 [Flavobacteriales bacterium]|nr:hypothetical protein [Flavobacteriales bacterium]
MVKWPKTLLFFFAILTGILFYQLQYLDFDYDYEKYFPQSDDSKIHYEQFKEQYGTDSDFLLIGIENNKGLFQKSFLDSVKKMGDELKSDSLVKFVTSPVHNCGYYKKVGLGGVLFKPYLDLEKNAISIEDSLRIYGNDKILGSLLAKNGKSLCIFLQTKENLNKDEANHILSLIEQKKNQYNFDVFRVAGRVLGQTYFIEKMITELGVFISTSILLLIGFLYVSFRSWWGVIIPLVIVIVSMIWTLALMFLTGKSFDLLMVMLPTIIFVVGMSDLVHLLTKYIDELRIGKKKIDALQVAFKEVRWATFLTSLTTSIGFFSLISANISPIKEFGIYSGISVFVAYFLAFTLLPSVLLLVKPPKKLLQSSNNNFWEKYLRRWFLIVLRGKKKVFIITFLLILVGVFTANSLEINNFILEDLSDKDPIKKDVIYFEENYSGLRPFEAEISTQDTNGVLGYNFLNELQKLEIFLKENYTQDGVGFLTSPLSLVKEANFVKKGSKPKYRVLPKSERRLKTLINQMKRGSERFKKFDLNYNFNLISKDSMSCRLTGKLKDVGGLKIKEANYKLKQFLNHNINPEILQIRLTGTAMLIDNNNSTLSKNLILGLILAFAVIALVVGLMFRSIKIAFLSLIPNILPLLLLTTVMWIGNIDLKISTSLIFTLAFGIAVDDTIHLLSKYKLERRKKRSHLYALKRSYLSSGKAIIVTSLILVGGFLTLLFSSFTSTFYMGLMGSVTLFIALTLDLMIMPLIMLYGLSNTSDIK